MRKSFVALLNTELQLQECKIIISYKAVYQKEMDKKMFTSLGIVATIEIVLH